MYDDGFFSSFVNLNQSSKQERSSQARRTSLLQQPGEPAPTADDAIPPPLIREEELDTNGPPKATVARRAQSFTDFYHVARAQLKKDGAATTSTSKQRRRRQSLQARTIDTDDVEGEFQLHEAAAVELLDASNDQYELYLEQQRLIRSHLDSLMAETDANLQLLSALHASFNAVETQTSAFRSRCENLLADRQRMASLADGIAHNLQYYNYLDPMTRRLNAPGAGHLARSDEFRSMLTNLDHCLEYMETHQSQSEASTYQARYKLLLTRGLTLIRVNFTNAVREISSDVAKRIADRQLNDTTMPALLYAKFRVGAAEMKSLALEIQKRANPPPNADLGVQGEYQGLMDELYQSYSAARGRLIVPIVRRKMLEMDAASSTSKDLVAYVRSSVSYMRGLCLDEYELWHEWFEAEGGLYEFLEAMCEPLYDHLRPRTIRETHLPKLCEMCSLVQARYLGEGDEDDEEIEPHGHRLDFGQLIRPVLQDAQTRLVFLAQAVLRDDIERFKARAEDLDYPVRNRNLAGSKKGPALSGRKDSSPLAMPKAPAVIEQDETNGFELKLQYDSDAAYQGWFPTLKKAIWLLSRIYRLVNSTVFDDLAHQIVHQTTLSLLAAAQAIKSKASAVDSQLFLLKQLLILKQQIVAFDIEFVTPELNLDFSSITSTFWELRERGGLFNASNLMRLVAMPRVVENMLDAKAELDSRLREVINDFVNGFASKMTAAIADKAPKQSTDNAVQAVRSSIEREARTLRSKLDEYMDDVRTKETLVGAVQDQALANYETWFDKVQGSKQARGVNGVSRKGKGKEDEVWDPHTFADWLDAEIFQVGRVGLDAAAEADDENDRGSFGGSVSGNVSRSDSDG